MADGVDESFYAVKIPRKRPRRIYFQNRRNRVAECLAEGLSVRKTAKRLGIGKSTVQRDREWLKSNEHMLRAQDVADEVVGGELIVLDEYMPTNIAEFRAEEERLVIELLANRKTYAQIADQLGTSISVVIRHANKYLEKYGDWGGRTMEAWRNEQLIKIDNRLVEVQGDLEIQAIRKTNEEGDLVTGWDLSPYQAAVIRDKARQRETELNVQKSRLLSLLVQRTEVDVQEKAVVVHVQGVDFDAWQAART